jgi:2-amino-4-hydroxy-6-hydroxymethyldihydropteridine diphosphokinase
VSEIAYVRARPSLRARARQQPLTRHGSPAATLTAALRALEDSGVTVLRASPTIATAALGPAGRGFANAAALVTTTLPPDRLLATLKRIERAFGRRGGRRWGARALDLDILLWSGGRWPGTLRPALAGRLAIPHGGLEQRRFVLARW